MPSLWLKEPYRARSTEAAGTSHLEFPGSLVDASRVMQRCFLMLLRHSSVMRTFPTFTTGVGARADGREFACPHHQLAYDVSAETAA